MFLIVASSSSRRQPFTRRTDPPLRVEPTFPRVWWGANNPAARSALAGEELSPKMPSPSSADGYTPCLENAPSGPPCWFAPKTTRHLGSNRKQVTFASGILILHLFGMGAVCLTLRVRSNGSLLRSGYPFFSEGKPPRDQLFLTSRHTKNPNQHPPPPPPNPPQRDVRPFPPLL